jgi:hypothetical protein
MQRSILRLGIFVPRWSCNDNGSAYQLFSHTGENMMSIERALFALGGTMVIITSLLALFHHPYWTWVTLFIGFNCLQSSFTGFCPPVWLMKKFNMKTEAELALQKSG